MIFLMLVMFVKIPSINSMNSRKVIEVKKEDAVHPYNFEARPGTSIRTEKAPKPKRAQQSMSQKEKSQEEKTAWLKSMMGEGEGKIPRMKDEDMDVLSNHNVAVLTKLEIWMKYVEDPEVIRKVYLLDYLPKYGVITIIADKIVRLEASMRQRHQDKDEEDIRVSTWFEHIEKRKAKTFLAETKNRISPMNQWLDSLDLLKEKPPLFNIKASDQDLLDNYQKWIDYGEKVKAHPDVIPQSSKLVSFASISCRQKSRYRKELSNRGLMTPDPHIEFLDVEANVKREVDDSQSGDD